MIDRTKLLAALAASALAVPGVALAQNGNGHANPNAQGHGQGQGQGKPKMYIFKGSYNADGSVHVVRGNGRVRKADLVGTDVGFDYAKARILVADTNGDLLSDTTDVKTGDSVLVQAKLPVKDPGPQPFAARKLIDQTNPPS